MDWCTRQRASAGYNGAPVKLFVRGANVWREEKEWPLPRAKYVPYYLRKGP